ncbi:MAG: siphovirus Gp157 family protein [Lachnospiraceae bacterium]|nr:siphovirus Gp157 family protein [Lachnospiraceae bacterium]
MNLFEIDAEIMKCVDMETGEIIDTERLGQLQMDRDTKIENIACWIKNLASDAEALKAQKQVFADRQKIAENKAESLKQYLATALGGKKFSTDKVVVSFRKTSSVNVTDVSKLPEQYLKHVEPTADKTAIKAAIKAGTVIDGAEIVEGQSISIK